MTGSLLLLLTLRCLLLPCGVGGEEVGEDTSVLERRLLASTSGLPPRVFTNASSRLILSPGVSSGYLQRSCRRLLQF